MYNLIYGNHMVDLKIDDVTQGDDNFTRIICIIWIRWRQKLIIAKTGKKKSGGQYFVKSKKRERKKELTRIEKEYLRTT